MTAVYVVLASLLISTAQSLDLTGCYGEPKVIHTLLQLRGDIYSPGYQEGVNYPDNLFCQYTIKATYGFRIRLTFEDLDLEVFDLCDKDAVEVFEGESRMSPVHGVFCGNGTNPDIMSLGNALHIVFRSDFMVGKKGFHLKYHASVSQDLCDRGKMACRNRNCFSPGQACDGVDDCQDGTDEENCGLPLGTTECGQRQIKPSLVSDADRIIGGKEATPGSWPWQADLQLSFYHPNGHMCGGTLINAEWILTAAHCFMQNGYPHEWRVHLGNHHKFTKDTYEQVRYVTRIIAYPDKTDDKLVTEVMEDLDHDIALMKLNAPVKFTKYVTPACLPNSGYNPKSSTKCVGTGWGMTRGTGSAHVLKEVDLWIEKNEVCTGDLGPINNKTMICVSNRDGYQDVCHGDSGGPLVCEMSNSWHVLGATSHGTAGTFEGGLCALPGSYTVYAKVSDKVDWIKKMINKYSSN